MAEYEAGEGAESRRIRWAALPSSWRPKQVAVRTLVHCCPTPKGPGCLCAFCEVRLWFKP